MKGLLRDLEERKQELDVLEERLEEDIENEVLEAKCDEAYARYYGIAQEVAKKIVEITRGGVSFQVARQMVYEKPEELKRIFA